MKGIVAYNEVDCKVMMEIVRYGAGLKSSGGKWEYLEEDQLGIELRFQLDGDWLRELHRFPLTRQKLVDGREFWKIGLEIMPPVTYRLLQDA